MNNFYDINRNVAKTDVPLQIGGCKLWLDPHDETTITLNGSDISQWRDKSGRGPNANQGSSINQPAYTEQINGKNVVTFATVDSTFMSFASEIELDVSTGAEGFVVVELDNVNSENMILVGTSINSQFIRGFQDKSAAYNDAALISAPGVLSTSPAIFGTRILGTSAVLSINGVDIASGTIASTNFKIGTIGKLQANVPEFSGKLGDVVLYGQQLSTNGRAGLITFLKNKWGI